MVGDYVYDPVENAALDLAKGELQEAARNGGASNVHEFVTSTIDGWYMGIIIASEYLQAGDISNAADSYLSNFGDDDEMIRQLGKRIKEEGFYSIEAEMAVSNLEWTAAGFMRDLGEEIRAVAEHFDVWPDARIEGSCPLGWLSHRSQKTITLDNEKDVEVWEWHIEGGIVKWAHLVDLGVWLELKDE